MKALIFCAGLLWILIWGALLPASGQTTPLPPGPLLAKPDAAQWQVTVSSETSSPGAPTANRMVSSIKSVTLSGNVRREETQDASGKSLMVIWCEGRDEYYKMAFWSQFSFLNASDSDHYIPNPKQLFPELAWVSSKSFLGIKLVNDKPSLVFGDPVQSLPASMAGAFLPPETVDASYYKKSPLLKIAYIDQATRLPVYYQEGAGSYFYQFGPAPTSPLVLPDEITQMVKVRDEQTKRLSLQPARS
jgi:hypothetical protein